MSSTSAKLTFLDRTGTAVTCLSIYTSTDSTEALAVIDPDEARTYCEESLQLLEGCKYEYAFEDESFCLTEEFGTGIVEQSSNPKLLHCGSISTGLSTGRLGLIATNLDGVAIGYAAVEVRSRKIDYRDDYRHMLEDISEQSVDLLLQLRSPSAVRVAPDPGKDSATIHQRFAFLNGLISSNSFNNAIRRIVSHPHRSWESEEIEHLTRRGFRPDARSMRQLAKAPNRAGLSPEHPLAKTIGSLPERILISRSNNTSDTPENRFVKFALQVFAGFLSSVHARLDALKNESDARLIHEVENLRKRIETYLSNDFFRDVSDPQFMPLGSPVLQRKEGYREVLQAWLRFDLAARLVWHGGEDVYGAGQRDIATLYEYWVFFRLIKIVANTFSLTLPLCDSLLEVTADGFGLKLKSGRHLAIEGTYKGEARTLRVKFSYNRTFGHSEVRRKSGSWTERMRPDYTLSLWPAEFTEMEAEDAELMVHIHFDAKYRIESVEQLFGVSDVDLNIEKNDQRNGRYKRADLLKMHAYRDAIRRTHGAYVLYPGSKSKQWSGFHEIIPGLGAFQMRPSGGDDAVETFVKEVVKHVCDRATLREKVSYHYYTADTAEPIGTVTRRFPERTISSPNRHPPIAESRVLLCECESSLQISWFISQNLCCFNLDALQLNDDLDFRAFASDYILLLGSGEKSNWALCKVIDGGNKICDRKSLEILGYSSEVKGNTFLTFRIIFDPEYSIADLDLEHIRSLFEGSNSNSPRCLSLAQLLASPIFTGTKFSLES